jgi:CrcB protein
MTWRTIALVAVGGAIGSMLRYVVSMTLNQRLAAGFPWATLAINVSGSFAIGVVAGLALVRASWVTPDVRLFLATGILGGFTTFSAFSLELVGLVGDRAFSLALGYALASLVFGFLAAFGGLLIARSTI